MRSTTMILLLSLIPLGGCDALDALLDRLDAGRDDPGVTEPGEPPEPDGPCEDPDRAEDPDCLFEGPPDEPCPPEDPACGEEPWFRGPPEEPPCDEPDCWEEPPCAEPDCWPIEPPCDEPDCWIEEPTEPEPLELCFDLAYNCFDLGLSESTCLLVASAACGLSPIDQLPGLFPADDDPTDIVVGSWWEELRDWNCDGEVEWMDFCPEGPDLELWCEEVSLQPEPAGEPCSDLCFDPTPPI